MKLPTQLSSTTAKAFFAEEVIHELMLQTTHDIYKLNNNNGLGIFMFTSITTNTKELVDVGIVAKWSNRDKPEAFKLHIIKYHVYQTIMPDELLDDMNLLNDSSTKPTWTKKD